MSNILFEFDANAVGLLGVLNTLQSAFGELNSAIQQIASSFLSINAGTETTVTAWQALLTTFGQASDALGNASDSMGTASKSAVNLQYELQQLAQRAADAAEAHKDAVNKITEQEQNLTRTTQEENRKRTQAYNDSMQSLIESHQNALNQIQDAENSLTESYNNQINTRLLQLKDPIAMQHQMLTDALEKQIDALIASGNTSGIAALQNQLTKENQTYQTYIQDKVKPYYQALDNVEYQHHQDSLTKLQQRLDAENQKYTQQNDRLKNNYIQQQNDLKSHYDYEYMLLQQRIEAENESYTKQLRNISETRQHYLEDYSLSGGGTDTSLAGFGPPKDSTINYLKTLGMKPGDPGAAQALQKYITDVLAFQTQLTNAQIQSIFSQGINFSIDPTSTRANGKGGPANLVNIMSDWTAIAQGLGVGTTQGEAFSQVSNIMQKIMSGQNNRILQQILGAGITKEELAGQGIKFKGSGVTQTITDPQDLLNAISNIVESKAGGLGKQEGTGTFRGIMTQFGDLWTKVMKDIGGDPSDPNSPWKKFVKVLGELFALIVAHTPEIEKFGRTIFQWVTSKLQDFVDWIQSKNGQQTLKDIGSAFKDIGDALEFIWKHKEVFGLIAGAFVINDISKGIKPKAGSQGNNPLQLALPGMGGAGGNPIMDLAGSLFTTIFGGAAGRYKDVSSIYSGAKDAGLSPLKYMHQEGWYGNGARTDRGGGEFTKFADVTGTSPTAARTAGFFSDPIGTIKSLFGSTKEGAIGLTDDAKNMISDGISIGGRAASSAGKKGGSILSSSAWMGLAPIAGEAGVGAVAAEGGAGLGATLAGIGAAAGPIALVVLAVAGLITLLVANKEKIMPFINAVSDFFGKQFNDAKKAITDFVKQFEDHLGPMLSKDSVVGKGIAFFSKLWSTTWTGIQTVLQSAWDVIAGIFKVGWGLVSGIILIGMDILGGQWGKIGTDAGNALRTIWDGISQLFAGFVNGIWGAIRTFINLIVDAINVVLDGISKIPGMPHWHISEITGGNLVNIPSMATGPSAPSGSSGGSKGSPGGKKAFADGGYYAGNQIVRTGERGPEMFFSNNYGSFVSNERVQGALASMFGLSSSDSGYGGMHIHGDVYLQGVQDPISFYNKMNQMGGWRGEHGIRGGRAV